MSFRLRFRTTTAYLHTCHNDLIRQFLSTSQFLPTAQPPSYEDSLDQPVINSHKALLHHHVSYAPLPNRFARLYLLPVLILIYTPKVGPMISITHSSRFRCQHKRSTQSSERVEVRRRRGTTMCVSLMRQCAILSLHHHSICHHTLRLFASMQPPMKPMAACIALRQYRRLHSHLCHGPFNVYLTSIVCSAQPRRNTSSPETLKWSQTTVTTLVPYSKR